MASVAVERRATEAAAVAGMQSRERNLWRMESALRSSVPLALLAPALGQRQLPLSRMDYP